MTIIEDKSKTRSDLSRRDYLERLTDLQVELVKLQEAIVDRRLKIVVIVDGRDAAGKDGLIRTICRHVSPKVFRDVALPKPSEVQKRQWFFQRFAQALPNPGEMVLFKRGWYVRGVVEPVMNFCSEEAAARFLSDAPQFEELITRDGILLVKFWLEVSRGEQRRRLDERRDNPLKRWKVSAVDQAAQERWDEFTAARDRMLHATDHAAGRWTMVDSNDKRRARVNAIRALLAQADYVGRDDSLTAVDPDVVRPFRTDGIA